MPLQSQILQILLRFDDLGYKDKRRALHVEYITVYKAHKLTKHLCINQRFGAPKAGGRRQADLFGQFHIA